NTHQFFVSDDEYPSKNSSFERPSGKLLSDTISYYSLFTRVYKECVVRLWYRNIKILYEYFFDCCFHFLPPLFLMDFFFDFNISSIDLKCCSFGFKTSNISSNPPIEAIKNFNSIID